MERWWSWTNPGMFLDFQSTHGKTKTPIISRLVLIGFQFALALHTCFAFQEKGSEFRGAQVTQHVNGLGFPILKGVVIVVLLFCGSIDLPLLTLLEKPGSSGKLEEGMACSAICPKKL